MTLLGPVLNMMSRNDKNDAQTNPLPPASASNAFIPQSTSLTTPQTSISIWRKVYNILTWVPPRCRWDPDKPPQFSISMNILFAFAAGFTVANLYYSHPILNILAQDFGVKYEKVAQIPTVMQAGYAAGLLFLCPLGDLLPRRPFVIGLVLFTATMWLGLCITKSLAVFTAISFIVAITTVTPQLMLPLVGDLAPPHRRATALSIVVSGLMLGILVARVLSGTMTNFVTWRSVYWMSLGLQYLIFVMLWLFMPDYPSTNPTGLNYFQLLWSILVMLTKHPVLVQACVTGFFTSSTFTCFWTTLTFLLAGPPYRYDPLTVGLFGLIGIAAMCFGPLYARLVTDRFVPHLSVLAGEALCLAGICFGTYIGRFNISGPILQAALLDFGMQTAQIANRSAIYAIEPKRRNGVNTAFMVFTFCGQLMGTAAGSHIYARGGWIASGSASVGFIGCAVLTMCVRGPWEKKWVGWRGGWSMIKKDKKSADGKTAEVAHHVREKGDEEVGRREFGEEEKVLAELAAEGGNEEPLKEGSEVEKERVSEKSGRSSGEDEIKPVKI
ncbi:MFS general substrate transporter [Lindgomyces ingoldianus]|uniref:MFS general substrate transporter n=1 Tax=Lindgomyces ingoldianus TaxID=673940 RepID=A0ACB6R4N2_9PLEO|nr:MFS general substrate transporter [Lindgomyces ingoldianus]KAF2473406.1 MFS general substrate transporter [Lindgomyces ingoldianus]